MSNSIDDSQSNKMFSYGMSKELDYGFNKDLR